MEEGKRKTQRAGVWTGAALFAAAFLAALLLVSKITVYCDDYFYGIFFRDGWENFWELTTWHYVNFNGRAFIHFAAELALIFDTKLYTLLCPLMLACVFLLGGRLQTKEVSLPLMLFTAALGIMAVVAMPLDFLNSSLLWISAGFNYLFPIFVLVIVFWLYRKSPEGKGFWIGTLILSFLAGATTEQSGLAAAVCLGGWGLLSWLRKELSFWRGLLPGLLAGVGYLTVIFAPGTWVRVGNEVSGGLLSILSPKVFVSRVYLSMIYMTGKNGIPALFVIFALLTAAHVLIARKGPRLLLLGFPAAGAYVLLILLNLWPIAEAMSLLYFIFVAVVWLLKPETTVRGLLMMGMLASQLVMCIPGESATRTTVPAILLLLTVCASVLGECLMEVPLWAAAAATAVGLGVLFPFFLPNYRGYAANAVILEENRARWEEKADPIVLNVDADKAYGHLMYTHSDSYLENGMRYYGVTDQRISYESDVQTVSGLYGLRAGLPVIEEDGVLFFPIQCVARLCGGEGWWIGEYGGTTASVGDRCYLFQNDGGVYEWDQEAGERGELVAHSAIKLPWYTFYAQADVMCELLDLTLDYDAQTNIYFLHW